MRKIMRKLMLVTFLSASILGTIQLDSSLTTVSAKNNLKLKKHFMNFDPEAVFYEGARSLEWANYVSVYNEKNKKVDVFITNEKIINTTTKKTIKELTFLLVNKQKIYYKNGLFYSNANKTKLFNGKFLTKKVKVYSATSIQKTLLGEGYAYMAMQATVSKGKMKPQTIKFPVWEYGKALIESKYVKHYYSDVNYYQGNGTLSSTNSTIVYNEKKKPVDLLIVKEKLNDPFTGAVPKKITNLTILLENNQKLYYKNGLFYSNAKKTKLFNGKFITKKVAAYAVKAGQYEGYSEGYAYMAMQATVSKGKMKPQTIKFPVWEYGSVIHPG